MSVDDVYKIWIFAVGKNLQQGYASPEDFHTCINAAQKNYASYLLGSFQQYTPGRPTANVELGQNSVVRQRLAPIIVGVDLIVDVTGVSPYPVDYLQTDAMWSAVGYQRIRYADQHKFVSIYNSVIDPVSTNPIYVLEDVGFRFFPNDIADAKLNYVKSPPDMEWAYTLDVNGIPVYDAILSIQPVFDDVGLMDIIARGLRLIGLNLQSNEVQQYANEIKSVGQ